MAYDEGEILIFKTVHNTVDIYLPKNMTEDRYHGI